MANDGGSYPPDWLNVLGTVGKLYPESASTLPLSH